MDIIVHELGEHGEQWTKKHLVLNQLYVVYSIVRV